MAMTTNQYSPLFRLAFKLLKYFLLVMFGFAIAYVMSMIFGMLPIAAMVLPIVVNWFLRVGIVLLCLIALVMVIESLR
ncbi:hypothetical protein SD80_018880 [Scytonema tolypothrichoides VB-61278]|nr:hypothetical protein SD80_018880 [Scytonema tolypothrichoides VB-61278]